MTPCTWEAIQATMDALSAMSPEEVQRSVAELRDDPLTLCFEELLGFYESHETLYLGQDLLSGNLEVKGAVGEWALSMDWDQYLQYAEIVYCEAANDRLFALAA